jgi:hypothetical protein
MANLTAACLPDEFGWSGYREMSDDVAEFTTLFLP